MGGVEKTSGSPYGQEWKQRRSGRPRRKTAARRTKPCIDWRIPAAHGPDEWAQKLVLVNVVGWHAGWLWLCFAGRPPSLFTSFTDFSLILIILCTRPHHLHSFLPYTSGFSGKRCHPQTTSKMLALRSIAAPAQRQAFRAAPRAVSVSFQVWW